MSYKKYIFFVLFFFYSISYVYSQEFPSYTFKEKSKKNIRNSFQISLGTMFFGASANIFYERIVRERKHYQILKIGNHSIGTIGGGTKAISLQSGILTGSEKDSHFEGNVGFLYLYKGGNFSYTSINKKPRFSFSLGYRLQRKNRKSQKYNIRKSY